MQEKVGDGPDALTSQSRSGTSCKASTAPSWPVKRDRSDNVARSHTWQTRGVSSEPSETLLPGDSHMDVASLTTTVHPTGLAFPCPCTTTRRRRRVSEPVAELIARIVSRFFDRDGEDTLAVVCAQGRQQDCERVLLLLLWRRRRGWVFRG